MADRIDEDLSHVDWSGEDIGNAVFRRCRFFDADLSEATTDGAVFEECDLSGVRFNVSTHTATAFLRCTFRRTTFFGATLSGCKLTGSEFLQATLRPLHVQGGDWSFVRLRGADLSGVDLTGVRLREADLTDADLTRAVLRDCDLDGARFSHATLRDADLRGASLEAVDHLTLSLDRTRLDLSQAVLVAQAHGALVD